MSFKPYLIPLSAKRGVKQIQKKANKTRIDVIHYGVVRSKAGQKYRGQILKGETINICIKEKRGKNKMAKKRFFLDNSGNRWEIVPSKRKPKKRKTKRMRR